MKKILHTYSFSREFKGLNIPLPVQSTYLRTYANSKDFIFSLPRVEWVQKGVYVELYTLLFDNTVENICMTSVLMLPVTDNFIHDLTACTTQHFHFPLENIILNPLQLKDYLIELKRLQNFSKLASECTNNNSILSYTS